MAKETAPFLLRFWWLPPLLLVIAAGIAAWIYRERPLALDSVPDSLLQSSAPLEVELGAPAARRVEYRTRVTIEGRGQSVESTVLHVAEHLGGGWMRRTDNWYEGGAPGVTYQERYLIYRNLLQVVQQHRAMAPFIHDLLHEFGWLADTASTQSVSAGTTFPRQEGSSLSVRQSRVAPTEAQSLVPKAVPYERLVECRRDGVVEGSTLGPALSGQMIRVSCRTKRTHLQGEAVNVYVWEPRARIFLLVHAQQPSPIGGTETQTRRIEALTILH